MQNRLGDLICPPSKKSFYYQGFFAVKWRAVFILGAMWCALVRGWWRDCVVGGMETRFQWRKAHSRTAKCEAFHIAPRLFFMFLFFDSIHDSATMHNLSSGIFHWTKFVSKIFFIIKKMRFFLHFLSVLLDFFFFLCIFVVSYQGQSTGKCANLMPHWRWI